MASIHGRPDDLSAKFAATAGHAARAPAKDSLLPMHVLPDMVSSGRPAAAVPSSAAPAARPLPAPRRPSPPATAGAASKPPAPGRLAPEVLARAERQIARGAVAGPAARPPQPLQPSPAAPVASAARSAEAEAEAKARKLALLNSMAGPTAVLKKVAAELPRDLTNAGKFALGSLGVLVGGLGSAAMKAAAFLAGGILSGIVALVSAPFYAGYKAIKGEELGQGESVKTTASSAPVKAIAFAAATIPAAIDEGLTWMGRGAAQMMVDSGFVGKDNPALKLATTVFDTTLFTPVKDIKAAYERATSPKPTPRTEAEAPMRDVSQAPAVSEAEKERAEVRGDPSFVNYNLPESTARALLGNSPGSWVLCNDETGVPVMYRALEDSKTHEITVEKKYISNPTQIALFRGESDPISLERLLPSAKPRPKPEAAMPAAAAAQPHVPKKPTAHVAPPPKPAPRPGAAAAAEDALPPGPPKLVRQDAVMPKPAAAPEESEAQMRARLQAFETELARREAAAAPAKPPLPPLPGTPPKAAASAKPVGAAATQKVTVDDVVKLIKDNEARKSSNSSGFDFAKPPFNKIDPTTLLGGIKKAYNTIGEIIKGEDPTLTEVGQRYMLLNALYRWVGVNSDAAQSVAKEIGDLVQLGKAHEDGYIKDLAGELGNYMSLIPRAKPQPLAAAAAPAKPALPPTPKPGTPPKAAAAAAPRPGRPPVPPPLPPRTPPTGPAANTRSEQQTGPVTRSQTEAQRKAGQDPFGPRRPKPRDLT